MQENHLEIIFEDIREKLDLVLEGNAALDSKLDRRFDQLDGKIELNSVKIEALNEKIDLVAQRLTKRIDPGDQKLAERIDSVEQNLTEKIDAVAEDLRVHRRDTEAHPAFRRVPGEGNISGACQGRIY